MKTCPTSTMAWPVRADVFRRRGLVIAVAMGCIMGAAQPGIAAHLPNKSRSAAPASWAETSSRVDTILDNTANILWTFTDDYFHSGDYAQSIRIDHLLFRLSPQMEQAYSVAAWLEWSSGDTPGAIRDLKEGIRANPNDYYMYSETGNCYWMWLKKPIEAIPYYIRATSFYLDAPWTDFTALAHAAEAAGDDSRALVAWKMARLKAGADPVMLSVINRNMGYVQKRLDARRTAQTASPGVPEHAAPPSNP